MFYIVDGKAYLETEEGFVPVNVRVEEDGTASYLPSGDVVKTLKVGLPLTFMEVVAKGPAPWPEKTEEPVPKKTEAPARKRPAKRSPAKKTSK